MRWINILAWTVQSKLSSKFNHEFIRFITLYWFFLSDRPEPIFGKKDLECFLSHKLTRAQNGNICLFVYLSLKKLWSSNLSAIYLPRARIHRPGWYINYLLSYAHPRPGNDWLNRAKILLGVLVSILIIFTPYLALNSPCITVSTRSPQSPRVTLLAWRRTWEETANCDAYTKIELGATKPTSETEMRSR